MPFHFFCNDKLSWNSRIRKIYDNLFLVELHVANENLLPRLGSNPGPAKPKADMLPSELARRAMKHESGMS